MGVSLVVLTAAGCQSETPPAEAVGSPTLPSSTTSSTERVAAPGTTTTSAVHAVSEVAGTPATVGSITDGDTFRTDSGERIRLIGIDTPEVGQGACFAAEATAALAALIPPGTAVHLELDVDPTDRFGRTLAYVHRDADSLFVNRAMALDGFAVQLTVPPNVARADELGAAVAEARDAGRGLWGSACAGTAEPEEASPPPIQPAVGTIPPAGGPCDASYPDVCIPPAPPDLDCGDIPHRRFTVVGTDPHGFDGNHDGVGCESG